MSLFANSQIVVSRIKKLSFFGRKKKIYSLKYIYILNVTIALYLYIYKRVLDGKVP